MTGRPGDGPHIPAGHVLLAHDPDDQRWATLTAWVGDGLLRGEKVILSGMDLAASHTIVTALGSGRVDVSAALSSDQLRFADLEDFYPVGGQEAVVTDALAEGYPGVRLSGPAVQAVGRMGRQEYDLVEASMDELCRRYPLSSLCRYDASLLADATTLWVTSHPVVADDMGIVATTVGSGGPGRTVRVEVSGEFDSGNAALLERALVHAGKAHGDAGRIELDLGGLRFLSVAAGRALLEGTAAYRGDGGAVVICRADLHLTQVLALLTVADHAGIQVEGL